MPEVKKKLIKDIGLQREVEEALPYAVVGGAYEASFQANMYDDQFQTWLNYVVPAGHQLKILFLRVWTQETTGARFAIVQTNPILPLMTGLLTEAYPVVGSVPPATSMPPAITAVRDYPMLEAAGAEILHGSLVDPIHVLEGSIDFNILAQSPGAADPANAGNAKHARYRIVWWGLIKIPEPTR